MAPVVSRWRTVVFFFPVTASVIAASLLLSILFANRLPGSRLVRLPGSRLENRQRKQTNAENRAMTGTQANRWN